MPVLIGCGLFIFLTMISTLVGGLVILFASWLLAIAFGIPMITYFQSCVISFVLSIIFGRINRSK